MRFRWGDDFFRWGADYFTWSTPLDPRRLSGVSLQVWLEGDADWTELWNDTIGGLSFRSGILSGNGPRDIVAGVGTLTWNLLSDEGQWNPRSTSAREGFVWGIPVRLRLNHEGVWTDRWRGFLSSVRPPSGRRGSRLTKCRAVDWMEYGGVKVRPPIQIAQRPDEILAAAIGELPAADRPHTDFDAGSESYPYALYESRNGIQLRTIMQRLALCEGGLIYVNRSGRLQFRNRVYAPQPAWMLDDDHIPDDGVDLPDTLRDVLNEVAVTVHPLRVDAARTTLYTLSGDAPRVPANGETVLYLEYRNPDTEIQTVGGIDLGGHTHEANSAADGTGADVTANIVLAVAPAGGVAVVTLTNGSAQDAYLTALTLMGRGVYDEQPITLIAREASRFRKTIALDLKYQSDADVGQSLAAGILERYEDTNLQAHGVTVAGPRNRYATQVLVGVDVGDTIGLMEGFSGAAQTARVQGLTMSVSADQKIAGALRLAPIVPRTVFELDRSLLDGPDVLG